MLDLDTFLSEYAEYDDAWFQLEPGEMQVLFDALLERYNVLSGDYCDCCAERARYGDRVSEKIGLLENEIEKLRAKQAGEHQ
jgi:hypothetical protein